MRAAQQIYRSRRQYNQWVGNQTLEDFSLRFTATKSRRWSIARVAQTALGATAFLALEAISATITLQYGFANTFWAIMAVAFAIILTGLPICYYAAKFGLDIDLLTRAAGFGYLGSTFTSLIYAAFTFIFFAIEASILASALKALLGIPMEVGYVICAIIVIPIVTHGITAISRFQVGTQGLWLLLQILALISVGIYELHHFDAWIHYSPSEKPTADGFNLTLFGASAAVLFAMTAQIGEQVDYLRFLPEKNKKNYKQWWFWLLLAGPGWILIGIVKMLLGSFIAYLIIFQGGDFIQATDPTYMYQLVFERLFQSPTFALLLAGIMVFISQMKINITNAYAGSLAWSNFFSRLTHNHPGRVVWLVFNVLIALTLMEFGIHNALESILSIFAIVAVSWLASVAADLLINLPLKIRPQAIEFKRSHLYDINPVGVGSMLLSSILGVLCYTGYLGKSCQSLAHFISLGACFILVPVISWLTKGRFYLAREATNPSSIECQYIPVSEASSITSDNNAQSPNHHSKPPQHYAKTPKNQTKVVKTSKTCCICEKEFEQPDMSYCPAYQGDICSLCCSLDARCLDNCKPQARLSAQTRQFFQLFVPRNWANAVDSRIGRFIALFFSINTLIAGLLTLIHIQLSPQTQAEAELIASAMWALFFTLMIIFGVIAWLFLLAHESREAAQEESNRQTRLLIEEIEAHQITDASLQQAKEIAENANQAKSRYLTGISHELKTPLQAILGYAQLLSRDHTLSNEQRKRLQIIHRNGDYLADLIDGLLDLSKIEAGRLDIYRNEVKLPELLDQLVQMFAPLAQQKNIKFHYNCRKNIPKVVISDEKRLRQILINLLSNAIKYTNEGTVDFSVNYRNQVAEFIVKDTGVGIEPTNLDKILEPFARIRDGRVPNVSGTGLGLTIVHLFTEIMGGGLEISSTPSKGSTFKVSLMLSAVNSPKIRPTPKIISGYMGDIKTAMIVDDQAIHRGLLCDLLLPLGFVTLEAESADHCHQLLKKNTVDIFLIDVTMPEKNGLTLAAELRQNNYQCPIIMISADAQEHHKSPLDSNHHDDYMVKPISTQALIDKIGHYLSLQWVYQDSNQPIKKEGEVEEIAEKDTAIKQPINANHRFIRELLSCADIGFSKGVISALNKLADNKILSKSQINHLNNLAENHEYTSIISYIEKDKNA